MRITKEKLAPPQAPAMSVIGRQGKPCARDHQDRIGDIGVCSEEFYALIHAPIKMDKAMKIPDAKKAVDAEWTKLEQKKDRAKTKL